MYVWGYVLKVIGIPGWAPEFLELWPTLGMSSTCWGHTVIPQYYLPIKNQVVFWLLVILPSLKYSCAFLIVCRIRTPCRGDFGITPPTTWSSSGYISQLELGFSVFGHDGDLWLPGVFESMINKWIAGQTLDRWIDRWKVDRYSRWIDWLIDRLSNKSMSLSVNM